MIPTSHTLAALSLGMALLVGTGSAAAQEASTLRFAPPPPVVVADDEPAPLRVSALLPLAEATKRRLVRGALIGAVAGAAIGFAVEFIPSNVGGDGSIYWTSGLEGALVGGILGGVVGGGLAWITADGG